MKIKNWVILSFALLSLPICAYVFTFGLIFSKDHVRWGEFGSYLSGIYGSLALVILAYTTHLTQKQFKRQNEDGMFFKIFDSYQQRISNNIIQVNGEEVRAHQCLKHIAERFLIELSIEAASIGRNLIWKSPDLIDPTQRFKIAEAVFGRDSINDMEKHQKEIFETATPLGSNERWESIKRFLGSSGQEPAQARDALRSLGSVAFYKIPFNDRQYHYQIALDRILDEHGPLLDGYFSSLNLILELAQQASNRDAYLKYVEAHLTRYEIIIIFYFLAGQRSLPKSSALRTLDLSSRLKTFDCQFLMIDMPGPEEIDAELNFILTR